MRASGAPSASTVATVIASASGTTARASSNHLANCSSGSSARLSRSRGGLSGRRGLIRNFGPTKLRGWRACRSARPRTQGSQSREKVGNERRYAQGGSVRCAESPLGCRRLGGDRDRARGDREFRRPPGERQRDAPRNGLPVRHRSARQVPARASQRQRPDRPRVEHLPRRGTEQAGGGRHRQVALAEPVRAVRGQPVQRTGGRGHHQGRDHRLHRGGPEGLLGRPRRRRGEQRPRRGTAGHAMPGSRSPPAATSASSSPAPAPASA